MTNTNINENRTTDVVLFAIHTRSVDRCILRPTIKCLAKKAARGVYDKEKALKAFYNAVNAILKDFYAPWFNRYHGTSCSWYRIASTDERRAIAAELLENYTDDIEEMAEELKEGEK